MLSNLRSSRSAADALRNITFLLIVCFEGERCCRFAFLGMP